MSEVDNVNNPKHYTDKGIYCNCSCDCVSEIECIDITRNFSFNLGNAIKYIWRCESKGSKREDLKKAIWYLNDEIKNS